VRRVVPSGTVPLGHKARPARPWATRTAQANRAGVVPLGNEQISAHWLVSFFSNFLNIFKFLQSSKICV
jgi:hypothetical protein